MSTNSDLETSSPATGFAGMDLIAPVQQAIETAGYVQPSPIQMEAIPHILAGLDVIGQAETGSGKTAAFALPLLSRIDVALASPQVLVLTPTRELALQVAESFKGYSQGMGEVRVTAIYGGAGYEPQLQALEYGMHIVVGTPGRVMDHMRRGTLQLQNLRCLVLDEADQMLQMGFIEDVEWILQQTPQERQTILFSATMPPAIREIADRNLKEPQHITVRGRTATAANIRQRACSAAPYEKLDVLCRILESEPVDGVLAFVKTRSMANRLADELADRGYAAAALSGELAQSRRERTVGQFKSGRIQILVATDVAARGLDVDRVSHVINYDFPHNADVYIHRVGRTGRAGRTGEAILFVGRHDRTRLRDLERSTRQPIGWMEKPAAEQILKERQARLSHRVRQGVPTTDLNEWVQWVEQLVAETELTPVQIAAALATFVQRDRTSPVVRTSERTSSREESPTRSRRSDHMYDKTERPPRRRHDESGEGYAAGSSRGRSDGARLPREDRRDRTSDSRRTDSRRTDSQRFESRPARPTAMTRYRVEVGAVHGVKPGSIVGALANEVGIDPSDVGTIQVFDHFTTVDLRNMLPMRVLDAVQTVRVAGRPLQMSLNDSGAAGRRPRATSSARDSRDATGGRRTGQTSTRGSGSTAYRGKGSGATFGPGTKPAGKRARGPSTQEKFRANFRKKMRRRAEGE